MGCNFESKKVKWPCKEALGKYFWRRKRRTRQLITDCKTSKYQEKYGVNDVIAGRVYYYHYWCGRSLFFIAKFAFLNNESCLFNYYTLGISSMLALSWKWNLIILGLSLEKYSYSSFYYIFSYSSSLF